MHSSHFQVFLIAALAAGLGATLSSNDAVGYPAGPAVSLGSNPIWSSGGTIRNTDSFAADAVSLTAPVGQDLVVTDIWMLSSDGEGSLRFSSADGEVLGIFKSFDDGSYGGRKPLSVQLKSGIRVPAGETVTVTSPGSYSTAARPYTLSGYYSQP